MRQALARAWQRRGWVACLLWPLSLMYGLMAWVHRAVYRAGLLRIESVAVPVLVVGNVVAGGAGKTPVLMAMVQHLRSRGLAVGVISRGYGRAQAGCREATAASLAAEVGDEPLLIATRCPVPVFVAARRIDAARALLAAYPQTQVILCDDGLQHPGLRRDIEICVFDSRGTGNGWLLPAGPLREPWPRPVDLVLHSGQPPGIAGFEVRRELASQARRADGTQIELADLRGQPLTALAGVAHPEAFFEMLRARGLQLTQAVALPDHHEFDDAADAGPLDQSVLCTEKDAVKLWRRRPGAWAVPLVLTIESGFWPELDRLLDARLSSAHGPQTA